MTNQLCGCSDLECHEGEKWIQNFNSCLYCPLDCVCKYTFSIANAGLAICFMLITKTRDHTGRGIHYHGDFNWSDLKDIHGMHLWSTYFISQRYLLLHFFEVTLMSSYFSFLIYVSVWHLYENKHKEEDCFVWHRLNSFMDLWTTKTKKRKTFQFCSKGGKKNLSLWALWHRCIFQL